MGWYEQRVLPRIMDKVTGSTGFDALRREVTANLHGRVLEIGFGSGTNVAFLPDSVTELLAVDPATIGRTMATERIKKRGIPVEFVGLDGASVDLADGSVDCVLSTLTLCTIPDVERALEEVARVLNPSGTFHFFEHGCSSVASTRRWQERLTPVQKFIAGGCHLNRDIEALIKGSPLRLLTCERRDVLPRGGGMFPMYVGVATAA